MNNLFDKENPPFLLAILVGVLSYLINSFTGIYSEANFLSYEFKVVKEESKDLYVFQELDCVIENIGTKNAYHDLELQIAFRSDIDSCQVTNPKLVPIAPSWNSNDTTIINYDSKINIYKIGVLNSLNKYRLKMKIRKFSKIRENPNIYLKSIDNVILIEEGFTTFIIKEKFKLIFGLIILCIILIFWYNSNHSPLK
jgi:hypothetical protein